MTNATLTPTHPPLAAAVETPLSVAQLRQLDIPGPRYTSYPTADRFVEAFGAADYTQALRQRANGARSLGDHFPL